MTQFDILDDCLDLFRNGRKNAAKALWESLDPEFRTKMIDFVIFALQTKPEVPSVVMESDYGDFILEPDFVSTSSAAVLEFTNG